MVLLIGQYGCVKASYGSNVHRYSFGIGSICIDQRRDIFILIDVVFGGLVVVAVVGVVSVGGVDTCVCGCRHGECSDSKDGGVVPLR